MENYEFERAVVEVLTEIIEGNDLKHDVVAKRAWGRVGAGRTWQSIRNDDPPTKLTLRDAYGMAKELGMNMAALCGIVEGRAIAEAIKQKPEPHQKNKTEKDQEPLAGRSIQPSENEAGDGR